MNRTSATNGGASVLVVSDQLLAFLQIHPTKSRQVRKVLVACTSPATKQFLRPTSHVQTVCGFDPKPPLLVGPRPSDVAEMYLLELSPQRSNPTTNDAPLRCRGAFRVINRDLNETHLCLQLIFQLLSLRCAGACHQTESASPSEVGMMLPGVFRVTEGWMVR